MKRFTLDRHHSQRLYTTKGPKETKRRLQKQLRHAERLAKRLGPPTEEAPEAPKAS